MVNSLFIVKNQRKSLTNWTWHSEKSKIWQTFDLQNWLSSNYSFVQLYAVILLSSNRWLSDIYTWDFSVQFHQKIYFVGKDEWVWLWIAYWPLRFKPQNWTFKIWRVNVSFCSSDETFFWSHFRRKKTFLEHFVILLFLPGANVIKQIPQ